MVNQGTKGNKTGNLLEQTVRTILGQKGFEVVRYREWVKDKGKYGRELLLENVPYTTIYNHQGKTEFLLLSDQYRLQMRIECKWQQVSGSVDEKLPYLYLNCIEAMPEYDIMILIDGDGWKPGSLTWLKQAVRDGRYQVKGELQLKSVRILNLTEFMTWANDVFV